MSGIAYTLRVPGDIRYGRGCAAAAVPDIAAFGPRLVLVHGANATRSAWLVEALQAKGVKITCVACPGEPDLDLLDACLVTVRDAQPTAVVACGGGAALDLGKALAGLAPQAHTALRYLEVVGEGKPLDQSPLPFIAIPTTAGTGAEATKNAVIGVPSHRRKVSLRDDRMLARMAIVDPGLTDNCPWPVTLASGLDACVQVIEPYLCTRANPVTDAICEKAIPLGLHALAQLAKGEDTTARDALAHVSLMGGIALANAGLGVVHGLAGPLGGVSGGAHGAICGRLLPAALAVNRMSLSPDAEAAQRFGQIGAWIEATLGTGSPEALSDWLDGNGLPRLGALGLVEDDIQLVAEAAKSSSSMKANPAKLSTDALVHILNTAL